MSRILTAAIVTITTGLGVYNIAGFIIAQQWVVAALAGAFSIYALIEWSFLRRRGPDASYVADRMLGVIMASFLIISIMASQHDS